MFMCFRQPKQSSKPPRQILHIHKSHVESKQETDRHECHQEAPGGDTGLIAFACYDSPAIATGGESMTESSQSNLIKVMCFGGGDPDNISIVDPFIHGLHRFTGLFTS